MSLPVVPVSFPVAMVVMSVVVMSVSVFLTMAISMPVPMSLPMSAATVSMMAVSRGMAWRSHRNQHQDDGGQDVQPGDVEKGGFDTPRVKQIASDERGRGG